MLQGSSIFGRGWVQEASSRVFSSLAEIFLLQKTLRVRTPSLQLRLHSDQFPMAHLERGHSRAWRGSQAWAGLVPTLLHTALLPLQPQPPRQLWLNHRAPPHLPFPSTRGAREGLGRFLRDPLNIWDTEEKPLPHFPAEQCHRGGCDSGMAARGDFQALCLWFCPAPCRNSRWRTGLGVAAPLPLGHFGVSTAEMVGDGGAIRELLAHHRLDLAACPGKRESGKGRGGG